MVSRTPSKYNLRSRESSKAGTPVKAQRSHSASQGSSPTKAQKGRLGLADLENVPELVVEEIQGAGFGSLQEIGAVSLGEFMTRVLGREPPRDAAPIARLKDEISRAWLRCVHALSSHSVKSPRWCNWLDNRIKTKGAAANQAKVTRAELVRQRQALKKSVGPRATTTITFADLKVAKARLTTIPGGKALKDKVRPEILTKARQGLKQTKHQ